jgi:hypothetical protein
MAGARAPHGKGREQGTRRSQRWQWVNKTMREQDLHKQEARLAAREIAVRRRERDIASREAELADDCGEHVTALSLPSAPHAPLRQRLAAPAQIAIGLWLMVAPLKLGYSGVDPRGATVACGAALAMLGLCRRAGIGMSNPDRSPVLWLSACITTVLLAVATLADKTLVAGFDDALGGLAAWIILLVGWPRPGVPPV